MITSEAAIFLRLDVGKRPLGLRRHQRRHQNLEQDPALRRRQTGLGLPEPHRERYGASRRGLAIHYRCAGCCLRPAPRYPGGLPARNFDATYRRYVSWNGENTGKGCIHHR